jgi:hypothetical protein
MVYKRQFIIQLVEIDEFKKAIRIGANINNMYLKNVIKNGLGYYFIRTANIKRAKIWKIKKRCETAIDKIEKLLDPTQQHLKKYKLEIIEITDNQTLREIKLKKINKK